VAAKTAKTEPQRAAAAESATLVLVRESEITDTATDAHLGAAEVAVDPIDAVEHVHEATVANQALAQKTAEAAAAAKTEQQRMAAAQSAAKVIDRENKIAAALVKLGTGQCDVHSYSHVTPQIKDVLLAKLHGEGMTVTGDNPWSIDTHNHDVKLRAVWNPSTQMLKLIVTAGADGLKGLVVCPAVWEKIDPILKEIVGP
jgi:hypothetical protein